MEPRSKKSGNQTAGAAGSEARLRLVIDAAPNAMLMVDAHAEIVLVNAQAEKLFGYHRDELLGHPIEMLVPARFRSQHSGYRDGYFGRPDARAMGAGRDLYGLRKDGSEVPIEIGLNPLRTDEGLFVLASIIDITERKRMTDRVVAAEARLRLVIDAAPNAMLMVNQHGAMTLVNAQAERLFGYDRSELLDGSIEMLVPERYRGEHVKYREGFFSHPDTRAMGAGRDLHGLRKDGSEVPIEIGLNPLRTPEGLFVLASIIDITERKRSEDLTRQAQAHVLRQSILDSAPFSIIAIDPQGMIMAANPASEQLLGYTRDEMIGRYAPALFHLSHELERQAVELSLQMDTAVTADHRALMALAELGQPDEREWTYVRKGGVHVPVNLSITALHDERGEVSGFLKVAYDITERKRNEATILHMAHHDALTGLPNRALLLDRIDMAIRSARRNNGRVGVLMMDLDHFKRVNDSLGHHAGDQLLLAVARRLQASVRDTDTVARLGGDEFVVVLAEAGSRDDLRRIVEQLAQRVATPVSIRGQELLVTPSIGGCLFPDDGDDANTLLKNADTAMYAAKSAGRSNSQWFSEEMHRQTEQKLALAGALQRAIDDGQFAMHYQPQVDLRSGRVSSLEALIRWRHPTRGAVSPQDFIPLTEETGLIQPIGKWVLMTACRECAEISRNVGEPLRLAVNVSPRQFQHQHWVAVVREALRDSGLPATQLELEITEGTLMSNPEESAAILRKMREMGVGVAIDDFGTGYSSLSYLTRFPIDKLKIDRSFVRDLTVDKTDAAVIDAIIAMAHSLGIRVAAEGVETADQLRYLRDRGCDEAQGFLFSHAVSRAEVPAMLAALTRQITAI